MFCLNGWFGAQGNVPPLLLNETERDAVAGYKMRHPKLADPKFAFGTMIPPQPDLRLGRLAVMVRAVNHLPGACLDKWNHTGSSELGLNVYFLFNWYNMIKKKVNSHCGNNWVTLPHNVQC